MRTTSRALAILASLLLVPTAAAASSMVPSAGCDGSSIDPGVHPSSTLRVGDLDRTWAMYVPEAHDGTNPVPVWLQLHGCCGGSGLEQVDVLGRAAEEHDFLLVGPDSWFGDGDWTYESTTEVIDASDSNPDVAFIDALIDHLGTELCIDLARVYVAGYSSGGDGTSVLACTLEDRIAAVAPVASILDMDGVCDLQRPVPLLAVHGRGDDIVYLDGGLAPFLNDWPVLQAMAQDSVPDRVSSFALRNGCVTQPSIVANEDGMERWDWTCPSGAEVGLVVHEGGHDWPVAIDLIWDFFRQHPMPE